MQFTTESDSFSAIAASGPLELNVFGGYYGQPVDGSGLAMKPGQKSGLKLGSCLGM
jgi:hypothetical protein